MSIINAQSWFVRSALGAAVAAAVTIAQTGCSVAPEEAVASDESAGALINSTEISAVVGPDGRFSVRDASGNTVFDMHVPTEQISTETGPDGRTTLRLPDGSSATIVSAVATSTGNRVTLRLPDGSQHTVNYRDESAPSLAQPAPASPDFALDSPRVGTRILPLIIGGAVIVVGGGTISYLSYDSCLKAYQAASKVCTDAGLIPKGGGCTNMLVYWSYTPPECVAKPK